MHQINIESLLVLHKLVECKNYQMFRISSKWLIARAKTEPGVPVSTMVYLCLQYTSARDLLRYT